MRTRLKDAFIPHAGNEYAPHALQRLAVGVMALLILLTFAMANVWSQLWITSEWMVSTILPAVVVQETNTQRNTFALSGLQKNDTLTQAAQLKAEHMAANSYFSHYSPTGVSPWYWFEKVGYVYAHAGENLAVHFSDSSEVVDAWMDSPTHRANILNGNYVEIGIGTARGEYEGFETVFVVQLFGTPAAPFVSEIPPVFETPLAVAPAFEPVSLAATLPETPLTTAVEAAQPANDVAINTSITMVTDTLAESNTPPQVSGQTTTLDTTSEQVNTSAVLYTTATTPQNLYSEFISTSTTATPANLSFVAGSTESVSTAAKLFTQPQTFLQYIYILLAGLVVGVLLVAIVIEWRRQQPVQIAYAFSLLFLMGGLWYTHQALTLTTIIL